MPSTKDPTARVLATVEAFWAAYDNGDPNFFGFFTANAGIFSLSYPLRLEGPEAYRRFFGPEFNSESRATQILQPQVLLVGEAALITSHNRIRANYRAVDCRTALLLVPDADRLRVAYLHMSPLSFPQPSDSRDLVEDIAVAWVVKEQP